MDPKEDKSKKNWLEVINTSKFWLAILVLIIAVGAYLDLRPNHQNSSTKTSITKGTISVPTAKMDISQSGFTPQTLIVKPGTEVTWTNSDGQPHKVAADPYPADNSIPGFDSTQLLQKGDSYSFSFQKVGTYHVHDESDPLKLNATITVEN